MDQKKIYSFAEVLQDEQAHLQARQANTETDESDANEADHFSICFSGGGIRSAAFNLGVLQALAEKKLLGKIDYLSTVSGGGYIGSWFMALLKRSKSMDEVQELLNPIQKSRKESHEKAEPKAIQHLRSHSNYLAPKVGIFSTDLWALWAIYLRNTFLNAFVLAPLLLAIIFLLRYFRFFQTTLDKSDKIPAIQMLLGSGCAIFACVLIAVALWGARSSKRNEQTKRPVGWAFNTLFLPVLLLFIATILVGSAIRYYKDIDPPGALSSYVSPEAFSQYGLRVLLLGGALQAIFFNLGSFAILLKKLINFREVDLSKAQPVRWIASGFLSGGLMCLALYWVAIFFPVLVDEKNQRHIGEVSSRSELKAAAEASPNASNPEAPKISTARMFKDHIDDPHDDWKISLAVSSLVPLVLLIFILSQSLQVGILGSLESRQVREKWSYFHAYCAVAGLGWMAAFILGVVVPDWIFGLLKSNQYGLPTSLGAIGGTISGVAIWLAQSLWTGKNRKPVLDVIVKVGPYLALAIGFCTIGLIAKFITQASLGAWGEVFMGHRVLYLFAGCVALSTIASRYVDVNVFSLQEMYENRLVRAFLGASQEDKSCSDPVTHINPKDDLLLKDVGLDDDDNAHGPIHLINTAINLTGSDQREYDERQADSFVLSPLYCGSPITGYRKTSDGYAGDLTLGRAFSTSGAAVSPNMGYYSTAAVTALLTFCNLRLGGWFPNPMSSGFEKPSPTFGWFQIIQEVLGRTDNRNSFIYLSDGGHFDNLGAYELVRRRCKTIYICDAGADPDGSCHELANLIRKSRMDFGTEIQIDVRKLKRNKEIGLSEYRVAQGTICYPQTLDQGPTTGRIVYLKLNLVEGDSTDLRSYQIRNPDFPHQSTLDQFYSESQFESYRYLGYSSGRNAF